MRQYQTEEITKKTIHKMYCNKCGRTINLENGIVTEGIYEGATTWGYFSQKDGIKHDFDLCEDCYDTMIKDFVIPISVEEI